MTINTKFNEGNGGSNQPATIPNDMSKEEFFQTKQMAQSAMKSLNEWSMTLSQNLDMCTESPRAAELAKVDALASATGLLKASVAILEKVVEMQAFAPTES